MATHNRFGRHVTIVPYHHGSGSLRERAPLPLPCGVHFHAYLQSKDTLRADAYVFAGTRLFAESGRVGSMYQRRAMRDRMEFDRSLVWC